MPTTIKLKNSVTTTNVPSSLAQGEVAINVTDKKVWVGNAATTPVQLLGTGSDGSFTNLTVSGTTALNGGVTLGDASGDALTINSSAVSIPNGLNFDSNTLVIDATNNRVGVGTASPAVPLHIVGGSVRGVGTGFFYSGYRADGTTRQFYLGGADDSFYINVDQAVPMLFTTNATERMRITSAGNVGIGTSEPLEKLDVRGIFVASDANRQFVRLRMDSAVARIESSFYSGASGAYRPLAFSTSDAERMRIDTSGNVGIGTSSPVSALEITTSDQELGCTLSITNGFNGTDWNSNDLIGTINFRTNDTSTAQPIRGSIKSVVENTTGATSPAFTALTFSTAAINTLTERMRLDSSGNLGLGVTPSAWGGAFKAIQLANGTSLSNNGQTSYYQLGANNYYDGSNYRYIASNFSGFHRFSNAGAYEWFNAPSGTAGNAITFTQAMTLDASGNLMVGATSSVGRLTVENSSTTVEMTLRSTGGVGTNNRGRIIGGYEAGGSNYGGYLAFNTTSSSNANTERMRIDSSGNVGIGTSSPASKLNIRTNSTSGGPYEYFSNWGTLANESSTYQVGGILADAYRDSGSTSLIAGITFERSPTFDGASSAGAIIFRAMREGSASLPTERMRLDSSGNLLVGATTAFSGTGFHVAPNGSDTNVPLVDIRGASSSNGLASIRVYSTSLNQDQFYVGYGGTVYARSTSISGLSDQREKENIRPLETGLSEVLALQPRRFDWKNNQGENVAGFVAQEVQGVLPDLIDEYKLNNTETRMALKMGDMIPTLVKAIQEQQAIINDLKARIETLESK